MGAPLCRPLAARRDLSARSFGAVDVRRHRRRAWPSIRCATAMVAPDTIARLTQQRRTPPRCDALGKRHRPSDRRRTGPSTRAPDPGDRDRPGQASVQATRRAGRRRGGELARSQGCLERPHRAAGRAKRVRNTGPGTSALVRQPCPAHRCAAASRAAGTRSRTVAVLSSSSAAAASAVTGNMWARIPDPHGPGQ
jgi:hypothetical protein